MDDTFIPADTAILDLLRKQESMTVQQLARAMQVTATAVRQRLSRLLAQEYIEREATKAQRGRPSHRYRLTTRGRRRTGANFADLSLALWQEIKEIKDPEVRRGLLQRISKRLADVYGKQIHGTTTAERMSSLSELFRERRIPFEVKMEGQLPVLNALACPYPQIADEDHSICAMERLLFAELLGENVRLTHCRLDGDACCSFSPSDQN